MSERDIVFLTIIFITAVWALSATFIATHLTGRRSILRWIIDDIRRSFRGEE